MSGSPLLGTVLALLVPSQTCSLHFWFPKCPEPHDDLHVNYPCDYIPQGLRETPLENYDLIFQYRWVWSKLSGKDGPQMR